jgi:hypothetical protein
MTPPGYLRYNNETFPLEEAAIYGIFTEYGTMTWWIELFPEGERNYIMFNNVEIPGAFLPGQLSMTEITDIGDVYEHTVLVDEMERFLDSANIRFGNWDSRTQSIQLTGHGTISKDEEEGFPEVRYEFSANLAFSGISIFETTEEETQKFVEMYLKGQPDIVFEVKFENDPSGLTASIEGRF